MGDSLVRRCRPLLGTFVEVMVPAPYAAAIDTAFAEVARIHAVMSFHDEASDLGRLHRAAPGEKVRVDMDTVAVLRLALALHRRSGGLFDVTVARALVADGFLPRPPGIDLRRVRGRMDDVEILDDALVRCRRPLLIDLGGIAKGHAVDRAVEALAGAGVPCAIVNAGGDLRVLGDEPRPVHLRDAAGRIEAVLMLADGALASSANLDRLLRRRGVAVAPHRGRGGRSLPVDHAVSVLAPTCALADAMTKVALADPVLAEAMLAEDGGAIVRRPAAARAA